MLQCQNFTIKSIMLQKKEKEVLLSATSHIEYETEKDITLT
jgi:hypothetical protein